LVLRDTFLSLLAIGQTLLRRQLYDQQKLLTPLNLQPYKV